MNISVFLICFIVSTLVLFLGLRAVSITFDDKEVKWPRLLNPNDYASTKATIERHVELFEDYPEILKQFEEISSFVVREYISSWFERIDQDNESEFPKQVENAIINAICRLSCRLKQCDIVNLLILKLLPEVNKHISSFNMAKTNISPLKNQQNTANNHLLQSRLIMEYKKLNKLHPAISSQSQDLNKCVEGYLRLSVSKLLPILIDNELKSSIVRTLLREILTTNIFTPIIVKFVDPDNWNLTLISISKKILKERNQVHKVRRILSNELKHPLQVNDYQDIANIEPLKLNFSLSSSCSSKEFEIYLRQLSFLTSYSDLRATKFELSIKLMKLDDLYKSNTKKISKKDTIYRKRLIVALNLVDVKLKYLQPRMDNGADLVTVQESDDRIINDLETFLDEIILDTYFLHDSICLPFFKRFLNMNSETNALIFIDFWETVETYKNPLENIESQDIIIEYSQKEISFLEHIYNTFLKDDKIEAMKELDAGLVNNILIFFSEQSKIENVDIFSLARKSVLLLQSQVEFILNTQYFPTFKKSSMFLKMVSSPDFTSTQVFKKYYKVYDDKDEDIALFNDPKFVSDTNKQKTLAASKRNNMETLHVKKIRNDPVSPDTVRNFTNPGIADALNKIVKDDTEFNLNFHTAKSYNQSKNDNKRQGRQDVLTAEDHIFNDVSNSDDESISLSIMDDDESFDGSMERDVSTNESEDSTNFDFIKNNMNNHLYNFSNLKIEINKLNENISQIGTELDLLKHLILKADLTNNKQELALLKKSQKTLNSELEKNELLRQQYIIQANTNSLYKKTKLNINSYFIGSHFSNFRDVIFYIINISHIHNGNVTTWEIPRRYSEFYELNKYLKITYKSIMYQNKVKDYFPGKVKINWNFTRSLTDLYESRKIKLLIYLDKCLKYQEICSDEMFRKFLTDTRPFTINFKDIDNTMKLQNDMNTLCYSDVNSTTSSNIHSNEIDISTSMMDDITESSSETQSLIHKDKTSSFMNQPFLRPICDLFISLFSLNTSNSIWLRGGAIILILQQIFGATIEKYIRDTILRVRKPEFIQETVTNLKETLWGPCGYFERRRARSGEPVPTRSEAEKQRTLRGSRLIFQLLFIDICGKVVGKRHAKAGATRIHDALQNPTLNASLLLKMFDLVFEAIEEVR